MRTFFYIALFSALVSFSYANSQPVRVKPYSMLNYDIVLGALYDKRLGFFPMQQIKQRVHVGSHYFLGKPYFLGALGEGPSGQYDQNPVYRTNRFDCVTYTETVLALARAKNLSEFKKVIKRIRYGNRPAHFFSRNHFTSVDWNPNMHRLGILRDITAKIYPKVINARAFINKPSWYRHMGPENLKLLHIPKRETVEKKVDALRSHARRVKVHFVTVSYIPLTVLFKKERGKLVANQAIFSKVPDATVIEIVRNPYHTKKLIGTNLLVSHMGLGIRKKGHLYFRNASSLKNKRVVDVPLDEYLKRYYTIVHPRLFGIHVERIL